MVLCYFFNKIFTLPLQYFFPVCYPEERVQKVGQAHDNKENGEGGLSPSSV
jgi:hypothetical protein